MRALLLLPLLGGCWLGNDFSRFEHGDGGSGHVDLADEDQSAASEDAKGSDAAVVGDGGTAPDAACFAELAWASVTTSLPPGVVGATIVSVRQPDTSSRLFLVGGCSPTSGMCGTSSPYSAIIYELTGFMANGHLIFTQIATNGSIRSVNRAAAPLPTNGALGSFVVAGDQQGETQDVDVTAGTDAGTAVLMSRIPFDATPTTSFVAAATLNGTAYVAGGSNGDGLSAMVYSLSGFTGANDNGWASTFPVGLRDSRSHAAMAVFNEFPPPAQASQQQQLWVTGGIGVHGPLDSVETSSDPTSGWTSLIHGLVHARYSHGAITAPDNRIYVIGGLDSVPDMGSADDPLASVEVTCGTQFRAMGAALPVVMPDTGIANVSAAIGPDNRIYALGTPKTSTPTAMLFVYGPVAMLSGSTLTGAGFAGGAQFHVTGPGASTMAGTVQGDGTINAFTITADGSSPTSGTVFLVTDTMSNYPARVVAP